VLEGLCLALVRESRAPGTPRRANPNIDRVLSLDDAGSKGRNYHAVADDRIAQFPVAFDDAGSPTLRTIRASQHKQARLMFDMVDLAGSAGAAVSSLANELFAHVDDEELWGIYCLRRLPRAVLTRRA
jgi:hypothetical protein